MLKENYYISIDFLDINGKLLYTNRELIDININ